MSINYLQLINNLHENTNNSIGHTHEHFSHSHEHRGLIGIVDYIMFDFLKLDESSKIIKATSIVLSDLFNIIILLCIIITIISFIQSYIPYYKMEKFISKINPLFSIIILTAMGFIAPTCICTNIPIFIGILSIGLPLYSAMCFLISGSLINISSILIMYNIIGINFTNTYIILSLIITIIMGIILYITNIKSNTIDYSIKIENDKENINIKDRIKFSISNLTHTIKKTIIYILISLIFSAIFSLYIPTEWATKINESSIISMFIGIIIGTIIHMDIISIAPLIKSMIDSNLQTFILIPFLLSVAFFSIPSIFILKKYIKVKNFLKIWGIMFILILLSGLVLYTLQ